MKKFSLVLTFLFSIGMLFLLPQVSLAATHHSSAPQKVKQATYSPGTAYYALSSIATTGTTAGTIGAVTSSSGLTLHINTDGTFNGTIAGLGANGSFQSDGSIQLTINFGRGTLWQGTAQPQENGEFVGTFVVAAFTTIIIRTGNWAIAPVQDPTLVNPIKVGSIVSAGPDQGTPIGGVMLLDQSNTGTLLLPNGILVPVTAQITPDAITATFSWNNVQLVTATGTSSTVGTTVKYTGTFVGPRSGDSGNWTASPFTFAS